MLKSEQNLDLAKAFDYQHEDLASSSKTFEVFISCIITKSGFLREEIFHTICSSCIKRNFPSLFLHSLTFSLMLPFELWILHYPDPIVVFVPIYIRTSGN